MKRAQAPKRCECLLHASTCARTTRKLMAHTSSNLASEASALADN